MACFSKGKGLKVRTHRLENEKVNAQGVNSIPSEIPGCATLSMIATIGKLLLSAGKMFSDNSSKSTKSSKPSKSKSKSTRMGSSKTGPAVTISVFCGWTRSNKSEKPPVNPAPAPAPAPPATDPNKSTGISFPKWPFSASVAAPNSAAANASNGATTTAAVSKASISAPVSATAPAAALANSTSLRSSSFGSVNSRANYVFPEDEEPVLLTRVLSESGSRNVTPVPARLNTSSAPVKLSQKPMRVPRLRELPPHLVIQPHWRVIDPVMEEPKDSSQKNDEDDDESVADDEFLDSESTLNYSQDDSAAVTPPLASVSLTRPLSTSANKETPATDSVASAADASAVNASAVNALAVSASSANTSAANASASNVPGSNEQVPSGGASAPTKRRKLNKKQRLRAKRSQGFTPPDFVSI